MSCEREKRGETDDHLSFSLLVTQFFEVNDFDVFHVVDLPSLLTHVWFLEALNFDSFVLLFFFLQTYVGPILLSMNPFKKLAFYTPSIISLYQQHPNVFNLPPHM